MLEIKDLYASYGKERVLSGVELKCETGKITTLLGKNGSGKSTLLKATLGMLRERKGEILVDGESIVGLTSSEIAKRVAYLSQDKSIADISVGRMVLSGRFPYLSYPRRYREEDHRIARTAMEKMGIYDLCDRPLSELSGGMRQKVYIAMALCQNTDVILMDEPTSFLDISQQYILCDTVRSLANEGKTVLLVLHDILLALRISDSIAVLEEGQIGFWGSPEDFITSGVSERMYGVSVHSVDGEYYYKRKRS